MRLSKIFAVVGLLAIAGLSVFYATRRTPACAGGGQLVSTQRECEASGSDPATCKAALELAKQAVAKAAPQTDTQFKCEIRFSECLGLAADAFVPRPSFCLKKTDKGAQPTEIRYLEYESDRLNRKKAREVRID
jgi:uncharacterized protein YgiB involved in biofilm formation